MKRMLFILLAITALPVSAMCGNSEGVNTPFYMGAGARELALGGSMVADPNPTTATFWNPSVLSRAPRISTGAFHTRLFEAGVSFEHFGLVVPTLDFGGFGLGVFSLGVNNIDMRDDKNLSIGTTDESRLGMYLGYGRAIRGIDWGVAVSIERQSLADYSATSSPGLSISASRIFKLNSQHIPEITVGLNGRNLLRPSLKLAENSYDMPYAADAGAKITFVPNTNWNCTATLYASISKVDQVVPMTAAGLEFAVENTISLRGGFSGDRPSVGMGVKYEMIDFDYAYVKRDMDALHMFNMTLSFGRTISARRAAREEKEEREFNAYLNSQLSQRNLDMISSLVTDGKSHLENGQIELANTKLDKAMFLALAVKADTTEIALLLDSTDVLLKQIEMDRNYTAHLDSATAQYDAGNYLGAKYFAEKALEINPESGQAQFIISRVDDKLAQMRSTNQLVEQRLFAIDSLIDYGKIVEAMKVLQTISSFADSIPQVRQSLKRVEFERLREKITMSFSTGDFTTALASVDSASAIYSDHPWCVEMRKRISRETSRRSVKHEKKVQQKNPTMTAEMIRNADDAYAEGQRLFESGNLQGAIVQWETVERIVPDHKSVRNYLVEAYKYLGVELYGQNKLEEAIGLWKKASALEPDNKEIAEYIRRTESEIAKLKELSYDY